MQSIISARLPVTANPKGVTQLTLSAHDNKCNTLTEDGAIKKIWS